MDWLRSRLEILESSLLASSSDGRLLNRHASSTGSILKRRKSTISQCLLVGSMRNAQPAASAGSTQCMLPASTPGFRFCYVRAGCWRSRISTDFPSCRRCRQHDLPPPPPPPQTPPPLRLQQQLLRRQTAWQAAAELLQWVSRTLQRVLPSGQRMPRMVGGRQSQTPMRMVMSQRRWPAAGC